MSTIPTPEVALEPKSGPTPEPKLRSPQPRKLRRWIKFSILWKTALVLAILAVPAYLLTREAVPTASGTVAEVKRGSLPINVLVKGEVEALESQLVKSEVRGQTKILDIVEEGYLVTEQDVKDKKVLVQLDDAELQEDLTEQKIRYASSLSSYTDAKTKYDVQLKQNESDITTAELAVKFARLDFEKYMGAALGKEILEKFKIEEPKVEIMLDTALKVENLPADDPAVEAAKGAAAPAPDAAQPAAEAPKPAAEAPAAEAKPAEGAPAAKAEGAAAGDEQKAPKGNGEGAAAAPAGPGPNGEAPPPPPNGDEAEGAPQSAPPTIDLTELQAQTDAAVEAARRQLEAVNFAKLIDDSRLDGDALQKKQELEAKIKLAQEALSAAQRQLEGTERLAARNFVTQLQLQEDQMKVSRSEIEVESANRNLSLFLTYEFPKQAEKLVSDYTEAQRKLVRVKQEALSKLMQARAQLDSALAQYTLQSNRLREREDRVAKCRIVAERAGIVIYAGSDEPWRRQGPIEKGATVYEQQEILSIPDTNQMAVDVKVHESSISKIKKGQKAKISVAGMSDQNLTGEVVRVSILPDTERRWMNPDVKEYPVKVQIDGEHEWLQRQMGKSAWVEIVITELPNIMFVPIQAVSESNGERVCYVERLGLAPERRVVEAGEFNDKYIEIKSGLAEGDRVLLRAPEAPAGAPVDKDRQNGEEKPGEEEAKPQEAPPQDAGGGPQGGAPGGA